MSTASPIPSLTFRLGTLIPTPTFSPRLGQLTFSRPAHGGGSATTDIEIPTPGLLCSSTRGIVQHLSRDHVKRTSCVRWVHVPFESFLQVDPPVPTRQQGCHPLHTFLGFSPAKYILSLSLRDPADGRDMPPNGKLFVTAQSSRGVRKVAPQAYRSYASAVLPDIVFPLSDVPFTTPPHSQKRIGKSIERSVQWLTSILTPLNLPPGESSLPIAQPAEALRFNVFLHMVGGIKPAARAAFSAALLEPLEPKERELLSPLGTLDEGVSGYVFDLLPLRTALLADAATQSRTSSLSIREAFAPLIRASLQGLPVTKPRLAHTVQSPHEVLILIRDAGVDIFDTSWAQQAAAWGVALDFRFPVPREHEQREGMDTSRHDTTDKHDLGHNLYDDQYAHDFGRLADSFANALEYSKRHPSPDATREYPPVCTCAACSPTWENDPLIHSVVDEPGLQQAQLAAPYTRAYLHHLLHTHEMSAHALLVMHNITVMDAFMRGIRDTLKEEFEARSYPENNVHGERDHNRGSPEPSPFAVEVARFEQVYDAELRILERARECWADVDRARGKGRLAREREKKLAEELGVDVEAGISEPMAGNLESQVAG